MGKKFRSVREMIEETATDQDFKEKILKELDNIRLSKFLIVLRCKNNLTQKQIAEKIGCTQSRVSKIESSYDADLSVADLIDYAKALNLKLEVGYRKPSAKIVDLIKYHANKISEYLNQLVEIAENKEDEVIEEGVVKFLKEAYLNLNLMVLEPFSKIQLAKSKRKQEKNVIHISAPMDLIAEYKEKKIQSAEANKTEIKL